MSGLEVAGLDHEDFSELPGTYTQESMPVHKGNIPKQSDLENWPHLKHVYLPEIDAGIELLIGTNVPQALEPLQVICSANGGPYAIKTMLGWTVNGPLKGDSGSTLSFEQPHITVNRVSVVNLDGLSSSSLPQIFLRAVWMSNLQCQEKIVSLWNLSQTLWSASGWSLPDQLTF